MEDNADMRNYLKRLLIQHYDVMAAANGQEALDLISMEPPDLVLSDVMTPVLDGLGMLDAIRANPGFRSRRPIVPMERSLPAADDTEPNEITITREIRKPN